MFKLYLGGTITAKTEHLSWRDEVRKIFNNGRMPWRPPIQIVDPLRMQDPANFTKDGLHDAATPDGFFVAVDIDNVKHSDAVMLVYWQHDEYPGYRRQSIGTWAELGIAIDNHIPVIVVSDDPKVLDHPFVKCRAAIAVRTVKEACQWVRKML